jgi:WD40 repeat protein
MVSGERLLTLTGHTDWIQEIVLIPGGNQLISTSGDNTLKIWELSTGQVTASFGSEGILGCCAVTPDGTTILEAEALGTLHFLRLVE